MLIACVIEFLRLPLKNKLKNIMKKLLLIITATILLSCSTEDNNTNREVAPLPNTTCACVKIEEYATSATDYTVWIPTGIVSPSDYPCSQNGYTQFLYSYLSGTGNTVRVRFRVHCE